MGRPSSSAGRPSSASPSSSSSSPFLTALETGRRASGSPGAVFARPKTAVSPRAGAIHEGDEANVGREEALRGMVGVRTYEKWLSEKAQQMAEEKARLQRFKVRSGSEDGLR